MNSFIAYLAGPITGCSFDEAVDWRDEFSNMMVEEIKCMSPMRGKNYLSDKKSIEKEFQKTSDDLVGIMSCSRGIITRDYNDCKRADILVVNLLNAEKVSIGTVMEIAWAKSFQTPVIAIMEPDGNLHDHPMINECVGFRVETIEQAADVTKLVLMEAPHR